MEGFLSKQERQELLYELRLERNAKFSDRIKCILLLDSGKSYQEISEFLFLSSTSVRQYKYRYDTGGLKELLTNKYVGSCCCLKTLKLEEFPCKVPLRDSPPRRFKVVMKGMTYRVS